MQWTLNLSNYLKYDVKNWNGIVFLTVLRYFSINTMDSNPSFCFGETCIVWTKDNRKVLGVPQSQVAANSWHQEEEKRDND